MEPLSWGHLVEAGSTVGKGREALEPGRSCSYCQDAAGGGGQGGGGEREKYPCLSLTCSRALQFPASACHWLHLAGGQLAEEHGKCSLQGMGGSGLDLRTNKQATAHREFGKIVKS